ncbi:MAG: cupin domain-containing protein [Pseudomonadota bacterium]
MSIWTLSLAALSGVALMALAEARQAAPAESRGNSSKALAALPLGPEIDGMAGRQLRMRLVTLAPGGLIAAHSHRDRPGLEYVLQGTVIEHRNGQLREYRAGAAIAADKDTVHGWENKGDTPVLLLPVDIVKE